MLRGRALAVFALCGAKAPSALPAGGADGTGSGVAAAANVALVGRGAEVGRLLSLIDMSRQGTGGQAVVLTYVCHIFEHRQNDSIPSLRF